MMLLSEPFVELVLLDAFVLLLRLVVFEELDLLVLLDVSLDVLLD